MFWSELKISTAYQPARPNHQIRVEGVQYQLEYLAVQTQIYFVRAAKMTNVKQAHQSFFVLKDNSRYLKDRRRVIRDKEDSYHEQESNKRGSLGSEPFQRIDISRLRSPNIPFVGRGINKQAIQQISIDCSESAPNDLSDIDRTSGKFLYYYDYQYC